MILAIDKKRQLWQINKQGSYILYGGPAPIDAVVVAADFEDGYSATLKEFESTFGIRNYNMRISAQSTTYELTITELKDLMSKELNVSANRISIRFKTREIGDDIGPSISETYAVEVVVDGQVPSEGN